VSSHSNYDPNELTFEVPYFDNIAVIKRDGNPYGFFTIHLKKGTRPKEFEGYYTSPDEAKKVVVVTERKRKETKRNAA
jgi:hypothetical protein